MRFFSTQHVGKRLYQEDRYIVKQQKDYIITAIFDGHGGSICSEYLKNNFINKFDLFYKANSKNIGKSLIESFEYFNKLIIEKKISCGSTANVLVIEKSSCNYFVCNLGDSRTIIHYTNGNIIQPSPDHKVTNIKEQQAIKKRGGKIVNGRVSGILNLSRAFGNYNISKYISSKPDVFLGCYNNFDFMIQASDGLFDYMSNAEICKQVMYYLSKNTNPEHIMGQLLTTAYELKGTQDNISIILIINDNKKSKTIL